MLAVAAVAILVAGCGDETGESGACAAAVIYDDMLYMGQHIRHSPLRPGEPLDGGVSPACHDTIPADPDEHDEPATLRRVEGVDPAIAVWVPGEGRRWAVYVNAGSFPELPGHPLHDVVYGGPRRPRGSNGGTPCTFGGTVTGAGLSVDVRSDDGRDVWLEADVRTRIDGFERGGWHVLRRGDRVHISGRCHGGGNVLARTIAPAT